MPRPAEAPSGATGATPRLQQAIGGLLWALSCLLVLPILGTGLAAAAERPWTLPQQAGALLGLAGLYAASIGLAVRCGRSAEGRWVRGIALRAIAQLVLALGEFALLLTQPTGWAALCTAACSGAQVALWFAQARRIGQLFTR